MHSNAVIQNSISFWLCLCSLETCHANDANVFRSKGVSSQHIWHVGSIGHANGNSSQSEQGSAIACSMLLFEHSPGWSIYAIWCYLYIFVHFLLFLVYFSSFQQSPYCILYGILVDDLRAGQRDCRVQRAPMRSNGYPSSPSTATTPERAYGVVFHHFPTKLAAHHIQTKTRSCVARIDDILCLLLTWFAKYSSNLGLAGLAGLKASEMEEGYVVPLSIGYCKAV